MWSKFFGEFAPLRAFFILACVFVGFGCVGFVFVPNFFILTHKFIFLQSVMGAAFAGFLLTALPIWLGFNGSLKLVSLILSALLILAFVAEFFLDAYFIMALFWFILLSKAVFMAFAAKDAKNLSILFVLFGIFCLTLLQGFSHDTRLEYAQIHLLVVGILLISFKISLVLGNDALANFGENLAQNPAKNGEFSAKIPTNFAFIPNFALKNIACFLLGCLILSTLWGESANLSGFLALSVGFLQLSRLKEWHYAIFLKTPYTATFYALNLALSLVYIALGGFYLADFATSPAIHALNILILLGFVLFVFFIASLKHTQNQPFLEKSLKGDE